jgi:hypothetical protein
MPSHHAAGCGAGRVLGDIQMVRPILLAALAASTLAACSPAPTLFSPSGGGNEPMGGVSSDRLAQQRAMASPPQQQQPGPVRHIAVTRSIALRMPGHEVAAIQQKHLAECAQLGCTVIETRFDRLSDGRTSARVSVRIAPDRYSDFAAVITAAPAEVISQSERAEDRTAAVLDLDKRLEVKTALRDRLTAMLKDQNATRNTADLLAIEKELAQVQGNIESSTAQRNYLRTITDTVRIDISYDGRSVVVAGYDFAPIKRAAAGAVQTLIASSASVITFLAAAIPWLPVVLLVVWLNHLRSTSNQSLSVTGTTCP